MSKIISFFILITLFYGRTLAKKNRKLHVRVMSLAIFADFLLVGYLVVGRSVLSKVGGGMNPILYVHIPLAISCLAFYVYAIYVGRKILSGNEAYRPKMKRLDPIVITLRTLVFITASFL